MDLSRALELEPRPALTLAVGGVLLVGALDFATGPQVSFSIFYLLPISLATLARGRAIGVGFALISAGVWLWADLTAGAEYSSRLIPYWNASVRFGYFTLHTVLLSRMLTLLAQERAGARRDALTGVANGRHFREATESEVARAARSGQPLTVAYLDLDHFKSVNDALGHDAGDRLLRRFADLLRSASRPGDLVGRLGGDEFALLLPATGPGEAEEVLSRIEELLQRVSREEGLGVGVSIGAVSGSAAGMDATALLSRADAVMYRVKAGGKGDLRVEGMAGPVQD